MRRIKTVMIIIVAVVLSIIAFSTAAIHARYQRRDPLPYGLSFASARVMQHDKMHPGDIILCGAASRNTGRSTGATLILSFGTQHDDRVIGGQQTGGSWTVRGLYPAEPGRPETVASYYIDGTFYRGTI